jgi:hypothetical protein
MTKDSRRAPTTGRNWPAASCPPLAKLRYTIEDRWHIGLGAQVKKAGFGQMQRICQDLVALPYFDRPHTCWADTYIDDCAAGTASTGNASTWVQVAVNRHLERVTRDLAILYGI